MAQISNSAAAPLVLAGLGVALAAFVPAAMPIGVLLALAGGILLLVRIVGTAGGNTNNPDDGGA